jgi:lipopolysaccharide export system protein LptA
MTLQRPLLAVALLAALAGPVLAQAARAPAQSERSSPLSGFGSNSREPIKIDADRLDVFDRENRAVYAGNVVAVQGDTTMRCATLTIHFERQRAGGGAVQRTASSGDQNDAIKRIECAGPVTIVSKDQVATGDQALYDRVGGKVILTGNVALSQGPNVTRGERLVYDVNAGVANIETAPGGRVRGLFVPGSTPDAAPAGGAKPAAPPAAAPAARPAASAGATSTTAQRPSPAQRPAAN